MDESRGGRVARGTVERPGPEVPRAGAGPVRSGRERAGRGGTDVLHATTPSRDNAGGLPTTVAPRTAPVDGDVHALGTARPAEVRRLSRRWGGPGSASS
ncbi:hypothetical protein Cph01nite_34080 [Cellulomonas phragmiteti]|uniref:Uncharacterized protein n=1 Tax=Cellulomonas phragmiteti TaxID=478780 RepID=A0ABQ4DRR8_9CELL|nr:hypothetical protein Cph01nite_34080 [Cellulomonas phragmiteti]